MSIERRATAADLERVAATFRAREKIYANGQSPLYSALAGACVSDPDMLELGCYGMVGAPPAHLFTAVHFLLLGGLLDPLARFFATLTDDPAPPEQAWPEFRRFCLEHADELIRLMQSTSVQTTYVERCRNIVVPLCFVADLAGEPLNLIEIGCSAGVLLTFDRYAYELRKGERFGPDDAPFVLKGELVGGPVLRIPRIGSRTGIDLNIIDVSREKERRWVLATCFPEVRDQHARLAKAMEFVTETDIRWMEGDALVHLPQALADTSDPVCVYHSACLFYWPHDARAALEDLFCEASRARTIYRVGSEPSAQLDRTMRGSEDAGTDTKAAQPGGEITITRYCGGKVDMRLVATSDAGRDIIRWPE